MAMLRRRVPEIIQTSAVECGAACLAMILGYYGRKTSIAEISENYGAGRSGLSALSIVQAARSYGLRVRAISLQVNDFRSVRLPAIVHWQFNHYLVVERWSRAFVDVVNPASGRQRLTAEEFDAGFTGVVILLEPGAQFDPHTVAPAISLRTYLVQYVKQNPFVFLQIILASFLLQIFGLSIPLFTKVLVDRIIPDRLFNVLSLLGIGLFIILLAQIVTMLIRAILLISLQARIDAAITSNFFEHLLTLPLRFFQQRSSGDILARVASNTVIRDLVSEELISTLFDGSMVITYLFILFSQSFVFAAIALLIGLLQVILLVGTGGSVRRLALRELEAIGATQGYVTEILTGVTTMKAAGAEQKAFQRWSNLFFNQLNISVRLDYMTAVIGIATSALSILAPLALLWVGAIEVLNGSVQLGTMLALSTLAGELLVPLTSLARSGQQLQVVRSHLERLVDVLGAEPEQQVRAVQHPPRLRGQITLKEVSFQYDRGGPKVLENINIQIEPGEKVAIVGRTGSGKSTLGKLLLGLCLPTEGEILYDGTPLHRLNYQLVRAQFGAVMQDTRIFSGSIRQNITFNHPDINMEQIVAATQTAALHEDIVQMPMGYETFVSEGGSMLSGGQRQRLAIACALAHEPAILLLDEATSALDIVTERIVERNLQNLNCTQIIIAHRLSTIGNADRILVLDEGRIVESGSHQELLKKGSYYAGLVQNQLTNG